MARPRVSVQTDDFDLSDEVAALRAADAGVGAVATFIGTVRGTDSDATLELEHYPGMTERAIETMIDAACTRFALRAVRVVHRVGVLPLGAQVVLVAVTAAHRRDAFEGCEFLMDYLKTQAPFWKKEQVQGSAQWVDARSDDDEALARWGLTLRNAD